MNNPQKFIVYIVLFFMTVLVDCLGNTIALADSDKSVTDRFSYDPWGYCIHSIGDSDTPFKYVGAFGIQTDPNGLVNMRARYYNPATKTFLTSDPSGFEGGLNWYQYASGDPFSRVDINGMWDGSIMSAGAEQMSTWGMSVAQTMMVNQSLAMEYWSTPTAQMARTIIPFIDAYANYSMGNSVSASSIAMDMASILPIGKVAGLAVKGIGTTSAVAKVASCSSRALSLGITKGISRSIYARVGAYHRKTLTVASLNGASRNIPYSNSITSEVSVDCLKWSSGWESIKGIMGQRIIG